MTGTPPKPQPVVNDGLLTANQAAAYLNIHRNTLGRWVQQGIIGHYRFGTRGDLRFRVTDLDAFTRRHRTEARP